MILRWYYANVDWPYCGCYSINKHACRRIPRIKTTWRRLVKYVCQASTFFFHDLLSRSPQVPFFFFFFGEWFLVPSPISQDHVSWDCYRLNSVIKTTHELMAIRKRKCGAMSLKRGCDGLRLRCVHTVTPSMRRCVNPETRVITNQGKKTCWMKIINGLGDHPSSTP